MHNVCAMACGRIFAPLFISSYLVSNLAFPFQTTTAPPMSYSTYYKLAFKIYFLVYLIISIKTGSVPFLKSIKLNGI